MPRPSITTTIQTTVKLEPTVKRMLRARLEEHAKLSATARETKERMTRLQGEVEELFVKAGEGAALIAGTTYEGHRVKLVQPNRSVLDKKKLVELGCDPEWLEEATEEKPSKSYIKITAPGEKEEE